MICGDHGMFWLLWIIENLKDSVIYVRIFFFAISQHSIYIQKERRLHVSATNN
jgi:hypothetical protein